MRTIIYSFNNNAYVYKLTKDTKDTQTIKSFQSISGNQQNAAFCFVSLANLFCCFLSMALIMVPKILFIRKHAHDPREKEDDEKDTAELELKYREILRENENFQKKISEVSDMMMYIIHCFTRLESLYFLLKHFRLKINLHDTHTT